MYLLSSLESDVTVLPLFVTYIFFIYNNDTRQSDILTKKHSNTVRLLAFRKKIIIFLNCPRTTRSCRHKALLSLIVSRRGPDTIEDLAGPKAKGRLTLVDCFHAKRWGVHSTPWSDLLKHIPSQGGWWPWCRIEWWCRTTRSCRHKAPTIKSHGSFFGP